jgi:hypothetical protein
VNPSALHGYIRSGRHSDSDIGGRERRRIVHPIPRHGDDPPLFSKFRHDRAFLIRQHLGFHIGKTELARNGFGRYPVVAHQHDHADAGAFQRRKRIGRRDLYRVSDAKDSRRAVAANWTSVGPAIGEA